MEPYYETDNGRLYCGDCLEIMPQFEPVDLVLTDPPYGIGESNEKNLSRGKLAKPKDYGNYEWDRKKVSDIHIVKTIAAAKNSIIFGGNYYGKLLGDTSCYLVWDKDNTGDFADCELAWTSFNSAVRKFKYRWNGILQECSGKDKEKRYHPTQKPVGLFVQILLKYSYPGETVLDPFLGSGTTAIACERICGLKWIGIEISEKYCEIAAKRIEAETRQLKLFYEATMKKRSQIKVSAYLFIGMFAALCLLILANCSGSSGEAPEFEPVPDYDITGGFVTAEDYMECDAVKAAIIDSGFRIYSGFDAPQSVNGPLNIHGFIVRSPRAWIIGDLVSYKRVCLKDAAQPCVSAIVTWDGVDHITVWFEEDYDRKTCLNHRAILLSGRLDGDEIKDAKMLMVTTDDDGCLGYLITPWYVALVEVENV